VRQKRVKRPKSGLFEGFESFETIRLKWYGVGPSGRCGGRVVVVKTVGDVARAKIRRYFRKAEGPELRWLSDAQLCYLRTFLSNIERSEEEVDRAMELLVGRVGPEWERRHGGPTRLCPYHKALAGPFHEEGT
jgi:hypothetical protein